MRYGNAGVSKATHARRDTGDDTKRDPCRDKRQRLLAAAPEDKGISALEPQDAAAFSGVSDQFPGDVPLSGRGFSAPLARVNELHARSGQIKDLLSDQRIVNDDVRISEAVQGIERQEARIPGSGTGQPDPSGLKARQFQCMRAHDQFLLQRLATA